MHASPKDRTRALCEPGLSGGAGMTDDRADRTGCVVTGVERWCGADSQMIRQHSHTPKALWKSSNRQTLIEKAKNEESGPWSGLVRTEVAMQLFGGVTLSADGRLMRSLQTGGHTGLHNHRHVLRLVSLVTGVNHCMTHKYLDVDGCSILRQCPELGCHMGLTPHRYS